MSQQYVRPALIAAVALLAGCGSSGRSGSATDRTATERTAASTASTASTSSTAAASPTRTTAVRRRHRQPPPGSLPQTHQLPSVDSPQFRRMRTALWQGIRTGSLRNARAAFFPEGAYAQVKAIADPHADYVSRLLGEYALDLRAAHALLGSGARLARLRRVEVPTGYAHWVPPGACYNRIGYYEVPNSRLVYEAGGTIRSFGIASMISWRGAWSVVHLGAVVRSGSGGVVEDPASGAGTAAPSPTC